MQSNSNAGIRVWSGFYGTVFNKELQELISKFRIGGLILFRRNIQSSEQLIELTRKISEYCAKKHLRKPLVAIDQEGGEVRRLFFVDTKSPYELAKQGEQAVSSAAYRTAMALREHGIDINLAPVMDRVKNVKDHFMSTRAFGHDPYVVAELGSLWIAINQKHGIKCVAKHFPSLSHAKLDPHFYYPKINWRVPQEMWDDFRPFEQAIRTKVWGIMISHARYDMLDPDMPALMSRTICTEWLRKRLGFRGVTLSDDLDMRAIKDHFDDRDVIRYATLAGVDCFLICNDIDHTVNVIEKLTQEIESDPDVRSHHLKAIERISQHT